MDAILRYGRTVFVLVVMIGHAGAVFGQGSSRTENFLISAPTQQLAVSVGEAAERYRRELADYWLGYQLPRWPNPCPIKVVAGPQLAAQGVTHYDLNPVRDFRMEVIGTTERILDSVLPHEVTHTILATHFGRPIPRWADEGACTIVEHEAEKSKHEAHLRNFLRTQRGIAMNKLFLLREYPSDIHPMYAQGYSVCRFLIEQQGPRKFIKFMEMYLQQPSWTDAVRHHYGYESLAELQEYWLKWVGAGGGPVERYAKVPTLAQQQGSSIQLAAAVDQNQPLAGASSPYIPVAKARTAAPASPAVDGPATLAATAGDSWYQRQRDNPNSRTPETPNTGSAVPPKNQQQPYSVAQPQPQQGVGLQPQWPLPVGAATKWR